MCRRIDCSKCGKPSFAGCGMHVQQVLGDVPEANRCDCNQKASQSNNTSTQAPSWLKQMFGR